MPKKFCRVIKSAWTSTATLLFLKSDLYFSNSKGENVTQKTWAKMFLQSFFGLTAQWAKNWKLFMYLISEIIFPQKLLFPSRMLINRQTIWIIKVVVLKSSIYLFENSSAKLNIGWMHRNPFQSIDYSHHIEFEKASFP